MNLYSHIKAAVTTRQAAERYGLKVNHNGMICCPFHQDKHPSMKVDERYFCFSCHQTGDAINFTAGLFHTGQYDPARKLAADFNIDISEYENPKPKPSKKHLYKPDLSGLAERLTGIAAAAKQQDREAWFRQALADLSQYRLLIYDWFDQYAPQDADADWHPLFTEACRQIELVEYMLSLLDDPREHDYFYDHYQGEVTRIHDRVIEYQSDAAPAA